MDGAQRPTTDVDDGALAVTLGDDEPGDASRRELLAARIERRLDPLMAVLAVAWALFLGYELVAPTQQRDELAIVSNIVWAIFVVEFLVKLIVSGRPIRFLVRRWPSVLFLVLPALRMLRVFRAVRVFRMLPAARVLGSSYRAIGTARTLLQGRLAVLGGITTVVIVSGAQLLFVLEREHLDGLDSLGDALWWSTNLAISSTLVLDPVTIPGRLLALVINAYSAVVFASLAAAMGAYFMESRRERADLEDTA